MDADIQRLSMADNLKSAGGAEVQKCRGAERATSAVSVFTQNDIFITQVNILLLNILKPLSGLSSALMTLITVITLIQLFTLTPPALLMLIDGGRDILCQID